MYYSSPIIPGFAPDPSIVLVEGVFYLATSSFHLFPGIPIYASRDLQSWRHIGNGINRREQLSLRNCSTMPVPLHGGGSMLGCGGLFAPTIRHHQGRFYIICTNATTTPTFKVDNFFIWTDDIWSGTWSDPIHFPFRGIDPSLYFSGGKAYVQGSYSLGMGKHPSCTIKQFEMNMETGQVLTEPVEVWAGHSRVDTEGPHIYEKDGYFYLLVAEGGTFQHHMLSIARSKNIEGPYEGFQENPIMTSDGKPHEYIQNIGHGELVEDAAGQWWAVVLGVRQENSSGSHILGRETFLTPVEWAEGGWPVVSQPKTTFTAPAVVPGGDSGVQAAFDDRIARLAGDLGDLYIRDHDPQCYNLSKVDKKQITLRPSLADLSRPTGTSTFVGRRQRSLEAVAEATLNLETVHPGDKGIVAGLAVYKHHLHHITLQYDSASGQVTFLGVNQISGLCRSAGPSLTVTKDDTLLDLKIKASETEYRGFVRARGAEGGDSEWIDLGSWKTIDFTTNEMTGPVLGVFATCSEEADREMDVVFSEANL